MNYKMALLLIVWLICFVGLFDIMCVLLSKSNTALNIIGAVGLIFLIYNSVYTRCLTKLCKNKSDE